MAMSRGALAFGLFLTGCAGLVGADFDRRAGESEPREGDPPASGGWDSSLAKDGSIVADDARDDARDAPSGDGDAMPTKEEVCRGNALACFALVGETACRGQQGCAWAMPTCSGIPPECDEAGFDPSVCSIRPACTFDFNARLCKPKASWCSQVTTEASCVERSGCAWSGGCEGAVKRCDAMVTADCTKQRGCTLVAR